MPCWTNLTNTQTTINPVPNTLCAYRETYSTKLVLLKIVNYIKIAMEKQNVTALIAIDLSVAFDSMNHQILLKILDKFYEIKGEALQWFKNYLENRTIRVQFNNSFSDSLDLPFSIPQGSCGSPFYSTYT